MRVLQLGSPNGLYGAERWILALIKHLDYSKVQSTIAVIKDTPGDLAPICQQAKTLGFQVHEFQAIGKINFSAIKKIKDYILQNNINILHTHGYKTDIVGCLATQGTQCKILSTPHGWSRNSGIKLQLYEWADRLIFPFFDAVAPLSDDIYHHLKKIPGLHRKLHLIQNGVDIAEVDAIREVTVEVNAWRAEDCFVVGYVGQLIARKGLTVLLQAFAKLDLGIRKKLVIVGDGNQRRDLEIMAVELGIDRQIEFLGFRQDRIALTKGFDAFVLPSRLEGIPRCLMEAMVAGVPVIASNIPGCRDLVTDGQTGFLFDVDNINSLLKALNNTATTNLLPNIVRNARQYILEHYSASRMANDYISLYSKIVK